MISVYDIAEEIVAREGGFVNDPDDPGGATNFGVTIGTARALHLDLDHNGATTVADLRRLTKPQAVEIFVDKYYRQPRLFTLPEELQASVFDMYVNAGSNAVKILQRMLSRMGQPCTDDGVVGLQTLRAARAVDQAGLADAYGVARRDYYYHLGDARPASRKYARRRDGGKGGWITRAEEFISPRLHLSEAQHRARVAAWA